MIPASRGTRTDHGACRGRPREAAEKRDST